MFSRKIVSLFLAALAVTAQTAYAQNPNRNRFLVQGTDGKEDKEKEVKNVANGNGGKVKEKHGKKDREFLVVEFPSNANPNSVKVFKNKLARKGYKVEVDEPMYPIPIIEDGNENNLRRKLADEIPWGISNIFKLGSNSVIPSQSYLPTDVTKPICIVDSGYMINHPDLPNDASNADPAQASGSSTPFDVDRSECSWHGTHVAGMSKKTFMFHMSSQFHLINYLVVHNSLVSNYFQVQSRQWTTNKEFLEYSPVCQTSRLCEYLVGPIADGLTLLMLLVQ